MTSDGKYNSITFDCNGDSISTKRPSVNFRTYWTGNLSEELQEKGYLTISDSVNRDFFGEALLHQNDTSKGEIITAVCKEEKQHLTIC